MDAVCRSNNFHYCRELLHLFNFQIKIAGKVPTEDYIEKIIKEI